MQDAVVNIIRVSLRDHQRFGHAMPRRGNQLGQTVPSTIYRCAGGGPDDYAFINAWEHPQWIAMLGAMGRPELAEDPRFKAPAARWENRAALDAIIEEWTGRRTKHEVMRILGDAGVPCGEEANTAKLLASEAAWHAGEACMQTFGGFAAAREYDIERKWRECRVSQIAPISTNLILAYIGEHVLVLPRSY